MAGFAELYLQNTQEGFRPRRRINAHKSETALKDEDLQRKSKEEIQQGLADKDTDFTPRESDLWLTTGHLWIPHHLQHEKTFRGCS